jgi:hypothetical protein
MRAQQRYRYRIIQLLDVGIIAGAGPALSVDSYAMCGRF